MQSFEAWAPFLVALVLAFAAGVVFDDLNHGRPWRFGWRFRTPRTSHDKA